MRGTILSSTADGAAALIGGDNGQRYRFTAAEWRGAVPLERGDRVAFVAEGAFAREVTPLGARPKARDGLLRLLSIAGRASRLQLSLLALAIGGAGRLIHAAIEAWPPSSVPATVAVIVLAILLSWLAIAAMARRLHDHDLTAWYLLVILIPVAGALWFLLRIAFRRGTPGPNRFGPDPAAVAPELRPGRRAW